MIYVIYIYIVSWYDMLITDYMIIDTIIWYKFEHVI